ncbi:MAG TPA: hypothetical protein DD379_13050 [Cyanobacteria bacterium UBA11162]|nr:hypothetical protein [Cyanobacteria bacterium UBA12227]HAX88148.1 hypothetical protein [Cyanobacteria bacterium UBA11370]HBL12309.1 hypothetical protein [Cyanobacteria bacterium UBA11162]HBY76306.1 hypothetical protein [Cyanobacteria bacterium UBA11148]
MATLKQLATVIAGTTSILSLQASGLGSPLQSDFFRYSKNLDVLASTWVTLPADAQSDSANSTLVDQISLASQVTGSTRPYIPPVRPNPRRTQGSGTRGCEKSLPGDLVTLLIPSKEYAGQTTSGHPTFFWYLSQPISVPMQFTLVEPGVAQPIFEKQINSPKVGIMEVEIPKDRPELVTGKVYRWSVTLMCNAKRPSANPLLISWIERVPTSSTLEQQLAAVSSSNSSVQVLRDRADIYSRSGLWYNALATIFHAQTVHPNDPSMKDEFLSLLDQVGLTQVVEKERQDPAQ